jgi:hypothetical protein
MTTLTIGSSRATSSSPIRREEGVGGAAGNAVVRGVPLLIIELRSRLRERPANQRILPSESVLPTQGEGIRRHRPRHCRNIADSFS